jgi:hypothetical protein
MSWDVIIPFLRPVEHLIRDPEVSDILVNGAANVFVERRGRLESAPEAALSERSLEVAVRNIARVLGGEISEETPLLDARLPRRLARRGGLPALLGRRRHARHPEVPRQALHGRRAGALGRADAGAAQGAEGGRREAPEHPHRGRHRHRQDHAAQRPGGLHPGRRADRAHRGRLGAADRSPGPRPAGGLPSRPASCCRRFRWRFARTTTGANSAR